MKKGIVLGLGLFFFGACGDAHMGENYGRRTRTALDAQAQNRGEALALDGDDARMVMQQHRAGGQTQAGGGTTTTSTSSYGGGGMSSSTTTVAPTPISPIRLDAVGR